MSFSTQWISDGTSTTSATGGGNSLPEEACGVSLRARFEKSEERMTKDGSKKFLLLELSVIHEGAVYAIRHTVWSSGQFSTLATLAGLPQGATPPQLSGKVVYVTCELDRTGKYINIAKFVPASAVNTDTSQATQATQATEPTQVTPVPFSQEVPF